MSIWTKISKWLLTERGQTFAYVTTGVVSSSTLLAHILPHTIFLDEYVNIFHLYKHGFGVQLTDALMNRFQKALDLLEVDTEYRKLYKPFAAYGFDIFSFGSSYSKYGVRVGIPTNFFYEDEASVDKHSLKLREDSITWELDEGKQLLNSLLLSEQAQLYAIAREIKFRDTPKTIIDTVAAVLMVTCTYGLSKVMNEKFGLYVKPRAWRVIMYCLVAGLNWGTYALTVDVSQVYFEDKIDTELKQKNAVFAEGGKEFYSKVLTRNIALRKLLGREGEWAYTALGNENRFIRYKHIPIVQRKTFFEQPV